MHLWLFGTMFVTLIPPLVWMGWLIYLQGTLQLPVPAGAAGMMGVMAGFIPWIGLQLAKLLWRWRRDNPSGGVLAVVLVFLVGLLAIMRVTGEFTEQVYGSFVPLFTFGFVITVPFGLSMLVGLWYVEHFEPKIRLPP